MTNSKPTLIDRLFHSMGIWDITAPQQIRRKRVTRDLAEVSGGGEHPMTDEEASRNVANILKGKVMYVPEVGWHLWNGSVWEEAKQNEATFIIREIMRKRSDCHIWAQSKRKGALPGELVATVPSLGQVANVLSGLTSDPRTVASVVSFDLDAYMLNTPGGTYDLTTGEVVDHGETVPLIMKTTTVAPEMGPTPLWDKVLRDAFPDDQQTRDYVESVLGLALFGNQDVQQFWMLSGEGGSGKGTILNTLMTLMGTGPNGYAIPVEMEFLMGGSKDKHPEQYARLFGKRLVVASEAESVGATFSAARVKNLTGGDIITGRWMRGNSFSFEPTWKLFLMTNYRPSVSYEDDAFWRRFREIPFRHKPDQSEIISNLRDRLVAEEGPAILARLIERARAYMVDGIKTPQVVRMATLDNREEQDHVERFLNEECLTGVEFKRSTEKKTFYATYEEWTKRQQVELLDERALTKRLKDLGYPWHKKDNIARYEGLQCNSPSTRV